MAEISHDLVLQMEIKQKSPIGMTKVRLSEQFTKFNGINLRNSHFSGGFLLTGISLCQHPSLLLLPSLHRHGLLHLSPFRHYPPVFCCDYSRMKFIGVHASRSGTSATGMSWIFFNSHAMLVANVRIVCIPSMSFADSPSLAP